MPFNSQGASVGSSGGAGVGGLIGGIAVLAGAGGKGGDKYYKRALKVIEALQTPDFDMSQITPADLKLVGEYFPEVYEAIVPERPELLAESPVRANQLTALSGLEQIGQEGLPEVDRLAADEAQQGILGAFGANREATLESLAHRGIVGGGVMGAAMGGADQNIMDLARGLSSDLTRQSGDRRLQALAQVGSLAGQVRGQDIERGRANQDAVSRFNEWVSNLKNQAAQFSATARGDARNRTTSERQRIADTSVLNRQDVLTGNLERKNRLLELGFQNEAQKAGMLAGALGQYGLTRDQNKAAREAAIMSIGQGAGGLAGFGLGGLL